MNTSKMWRILISVAILALLVTACAPAADEPVADEPVDEPAEEPMAEAPTQVQYCSMYSTSITDNGWDRSGHESFLRFQANPPVDIEVLDLKFTEGLWGDEAAAAARAYAESGCDIIWMHGGYNDIINDIQDDYPDVMLVEVGSGIISARDNNYHFVQRCNDGMYALGVLAGHLTTGGAIGAVGTFPAEDVNDNMNGFFDGAKSVNPDLAQKVAFINSWYDPVMAGEAANAQVAAGADFVFMLAENFEVCTENDILCFGPYIDYSEIYPDAALGSFLASWDPAYEWTLENWYEVQTTDAEFAGEAYGLTINMLNGGCDVVLSDELAATLDPEAVQAFEDTRQAILDGELVVELDISEPQSE